MTAHYTLRLMFEWGGGCLWCDNDDARAAFGVGPNEDRLPLSPATRQRLIEMSAWHDGALDWNHPPDPSPWTPAERERFDRAAADVLVTVESELGPHFEVVYDSL